MRIKQKGKKKKEPELKDPAIFAAHLGGAKAPCRVVVLQAVDAARLLVALIRRISTRLRLKTSGHLPVRLRRVVSVSVAKRPLPAHGGQAVVRRQQVAAVDLALLAEDVQRRQDLLR